VKTRTLTSCKVVVFILLFGVFESQAQTIEQQVIGSIGNEYVSSTSKVAFTIGEPITTTLIGQQNIISQGFHQGTLNITAVREDLPIIELKVYPNPALESLTVTASSMDSEWKLQTVDGKTVMFGTLRQGSNTIDMTTVAQSTYILTIFTSNNQTNSYRIVKME
jgi:hypothetical protein